ncbi:hypothetical protein BU23DRAFT_231301 [Bimuria novae-zelandiae CBS 107.79]|uniref:Uncharacterized protein n=1 Tax=Bimuria novae-zelandiae CBS 107.79 TaxID=1447943 RepID=A0A6A5V988_9PLEO|nr:hypothetical protein BU23DRAFT_231301 [Bimuria novae-zelandiae CBS 107.79]
MVMKAIGENKIHWYGISSDTHSAHTFAALYPEAVRKFVLDGRPFLPLMRNMALSVSGVGRSDFAYTTTDNQPDSIVDAELALEAFFITCNSAKAACSSKGASTSAQQLKARFKVIDQKLESTPFASPGFQAIDWSVFHLFLLTAVIDSSAFFPILADFLTELE